MKVKEYLKNKLKQGAVHITLIDPSRQLPEAAGRLAHTAQEVGSDLVLIGSTSSTGQRALMETAEAVKEKVTIPVIYLPSGSESISLNLDALLFLSMLNSRNARFISTNPCPHRPGFKTALRGNYSSGLYPRGTGNENR